MTNKSRLTPTHSDIFEPLCMSLRKQDGDARISELVDVLKRKGYAQGEILAQVVHAVGSNASVRVQRIAAQRAQHIATGTWQRYRMSRTRRIKLWLRDALASLADALHRLRLAVGRS